MSMTVRETLKHCSELGKEQGFTLRKHKSLRINNSTAYYIVVRNTDTCILENCTLSSAYNNICSGYIEQKVKELLK